MKKQILVGLSAAALTLVFVSEIINSLSLSFEHKESRSSSAEAAAVLTQTSAGKAYNYITPEVKTQAVYSDVIKLVISNYESYGSEAKITAYVGGKKVSTTTAAALKKASGRLNITDDGENTLMPDSGYSIKITAEYKDGKKLTKSFKINTSADSYWTVHKGAEVFERNENGLSKLFTAEDERIYKGELVDEQLEPIAGRSKSVKARYLKVSVPVADGVNLYNEVQYVCKTYYVDYKLNKTVNRKSQSAARTAVVNYAKYMSKIPNQTYILSGEYVTDSETQSDCSGMTELCYLQIGYYLEHYADRQANNYGEVIYDNLEYSENVSGVETYTVKDESSRVDYSSLLKGDLVFFLTSTNHADNNELYVEGGIGHVGMYIGEGKMIHFTDDYGIYNNPCRVEDLASYEQTLPVVKVVRYIL